MRPIIVGLVLDLDKFGLRQSGVRMSKNHELGRFFANVLLG